VPGVAELDQESDAGASLSANPIADKEVIG